MTFSLAIIDTPGLRRIYERQKVSDEEQRIRRIEGMVLIIAHGLCQGQITHKDRDQLLWMMSDLMSDMAARA